MAQFNHIDLIEFPAKSIEGLKASKQFFSDVFDWGFQEWGDDYVDTKDSGVSSGIIADSQAQSRTPLTVVYVEDLEVARKKVIAAGGIVTKEIFSFPGGRRFHFEEPSGNELAAWSE